VLIISDEEVIRYMESDNSLYGKRKCIGSLEKLSSGYMYDALEKNEMAIGYSQRHWHDALEKNEMAIGYSQRHWPLNIIVDWLQGDYACCSALPTFHCCGLCACE